jgi:hypothetical protein
MAGQKRIPGRIERIDNWTNIFKIRQAAHFTKVADTTKMGQVKLDG